jgi:hypothetical protein
MSRLGASVVVVLLLGVGCPIDPAAAPTFGRACVNDCGAGYRCDLDFGVCVPDAGALGPALASLVADVDEVLPGATVRFIVAARDDARCTLTASFLADTAITPNRPTPVAMPLDPGNYAVAVECVRDQLTEELDEPLIIHVFRVHAGDAVFRDDDSLAAFAGVEVVTGSLRCDQCVLESLDPLATLRVVDGDVDFRPADGVRALALPALRSVGGGFIVDPRALGDRLRTLDLPLLERVGRDVEGRGFVIHGFNDFNDEGLTAIRAPLLAVVGGDVVIGGYEIPVLENPGTWTSRGLFDLVELDLSSLQTVAGSLDIEDAEALQDFQLPELTTLTGPLVVANVNITRLECERLDSAGGVIVLLNRALDTVALPALRQTTLPPDDDRQTAIYLSYFDNADLFAPGDIMFFENSGDGESGNSGIVTLDLDRLETAAGRVLIDTTNVDAIDLPRLTAAAGVRSNNNGFAGSIALPALATVGAGGLHLSGTGELTLTGLEELAAVEGDVVWSNFATQPSALPALTEVGGELDLSGVAEGTRFDALVSVGTLVFERDQVVGDGTRRTTAGLPDDVVIGSLRVLGSSLTSLTGLPTPREALLVEGNAGLTTVDLLPGGGSADVAVTIRNNGSLGSVRFATTRAGDIDIVDNNTLATLDLGSVATVTGDLVIDSLALADLRACALTSAGSVTVRDTALVDLDGIGALASCGQLTIENNSRLPQCFVDDLDARTGIGTTTSSGNGGSAPGLCTVDVARCGG